MTPGQQWRVMGNCSSFLIKRKKMYSSESQNPKVHTSATRCWFTRLWTWSQQLTAKVSSRSQSEEPASKSQSLPRCGPPSTPTPRPPSAAWCTQSVRTSTALICMWQPPPELAPPQAAREKLWQESGSWPTLQLRSTIPKAVKTPPDFSINIKVWINKCKSIQSEKQMLKSTRCFTSLHST